MVCFPRIEKENMKTVFLAALVLLCAACLTNGHSGFKWVCELKKITMTCVHYRCYSYVYVCNRCYYKRSLGGEDKREIEIGFPCKFSDYDKNDDGKMTIGEFTSTTGLSQSNSVLMESFKAADSDDSGDISCDEFKAAPFDFKDNCKPTCN